MELRFIVICMSVFVLFPLYSTNAKSLTSVLGDDITMSCFLDSGTKEYFVDLVYLGMSSNTSTVIAKYEGQSKRVAQVATQFTNRLEFSPLTSITIKNVRLEDEGKYTCVLRSFHIVGEPEISNSLEVYVRPTIEASCMNDPLTAGMNPVNAASCSAQNGKPQPVVSWYTDRHLAFKQSKSSELGTVSGTYSSYTKLYVTPTKFYNKQVFYCKILHPVLPNGKDTTEITLNVQYPPSTPTIDVINQNTQLECTSDGNPSPTIKWTMLNTPNSNIIRIISPNDPARQNDTYLCTASNGILPSSSNSISISEAVTHVETPPPPTTDSGEVLSGTQTTNQHLQETKRQNITTRKTITEETGKEFKYAVIGMGVVIAVLLIMFAVHMYKFKRSKLTERQKERDISLAEEDIPLAEVARPQSKRTERPREEDVITSQEENLGLRNEDYIEMAATQPSRHVYEEILENIPLAEDVGYEIPIPRLQYVNVQ